MKIFLQEAENLQILNLPKEVNGNYWLKNSNRKNLVNIDAQDSKWILHSNVDFKIVKDINYNENEVLTNMNQIDYVELKAHLSFYIIELLTSKIYKVFCLPIYDSSVIQLLIDFKNTKEITIGRSKKATLNCDIEEFAENQSIITFTNEGYVIQNNNLKVPLFINYLKTDKSKLSNGDMIFIDGIIIYIVGNLLIINNPNNCVFYDSLKLTKRILQQYQKKEYVSEFETFLEVFDESEYFQRPPRFKRIIEKKEYVIDPPTKSEIKDEMPLIYTVGPMMLMGMTSMISGIMAIINVVSGKAALKDSLTPIITSIAMFGGMILFPLAQNAYVKFSRKRIERKRRRKYKKYIEAKKIEILQEIEIQRQILIENNVDLKATAVVILKKQRTLWDRKIDHPDFLNIRLGIGNVKPEIEIKLPEEHFTMEEDTLSDLYKDVFKDIDIIREVPVTADLLNNKITGIIGNYNYVKNFIDGLMLKILAFHGYDVLKIAVITSSEKKNTWNKYKNIPHFWNNEKSFRFISTGTDEINNLSNCLVQVLNERINSEDENEKNKDEEDKYKKFKQYYLIISDEIDSLVNTTIYNELINLEKNYGFSLLLITDKIDKLPNQCNLFLNVQPNNCGMFENELMSNNQISFVPDMPEFAFNKCYIDLCNIPIDVSEGKFELPKTYGFLEMYDVGNVKQLNILNRWKENNPINSLSAPVGINEQGELFNIDLHEKFHGPHGLVAGMTGSGKSEWIITYVLSMCINYHPDEVQFVLIDYKGGGLAGTFENKETGFKIPHLAGTITNLDVAEINRSLASINSELKRRQALFNAARDKLGESSVDIYKYQRWYRDHKIDTPISHLFLISDEFAELKAQQPEFMNELISTARIGRSLGVHLILATQKPSGVVNEQIWSNSKFKVCLKVQDQADSKEMILVPDAAYLKEVGRFYLQVGYNEYFAKGQSAYAGCVYHESDIHKQTVDTDIEFLDNLGNVYKQINSKKQNLISTNKGDELSNVLKEIVKVGEDADIHIKKLWLDAIPAKIYVDELIKKYGYEKKPYSLNPIIGEYDAPQYQQQNLLTLDMSNGNTLIYGLAGSGKENVLQTIIYSLALYHFEKEVNIYIMDFGAEVLNSFDSLPIVGDIITVSEEEKINNCFKFLNKEFEKRKSLFKDFNGSYEYYVKNSGQTLPNILVILNNYENFCELYQDKYEDNLIKLTREAEKYGILFIMTVMSSNGIRFKLSQNFKQSLCLQLKDKFDYVSILGNGCKVVPSNIKGRGVVKINKGFFEFQTSIPKNVEDLNKYLIEFSKELLNKYPEKAPIIKVLPKLVNKDYLLPYYKDIHSIPIGVYEDDLNVCYYDFFKNKFNIIMTEYNESLEDFNKSFLSLISAILTQNKDYKVVVFDGMNSYDFLQQVGIPCIKEKFLEAFKLIVDKLNNSTKSHRDTIIYFTNFNKILNENTEIKDIINKNLDSIFGKNNVSLIFVDNMKTISSIKMDKWFTSANLSTVIYIGDNITEQYIFPVKSFKDKSAKAYSGYVINNSKARKIKLIKE